MSALFSSGPIGRSASKNLVEFRAGKMHLKSTTVTSDKRKGLLYLHQSDDALIHFCWKDRTSGNVEDDLIIFPEDCEFKRIQQCTTGRVYLLKFKSSSRKFFFWMQEPKTDKDDEHCKKVNEYLNNPPTPSAAGGSRSGGSHGMTPDMAALGGSLSDTNIQSMLNNMDQQQLMQLLNASGGGAGLGGLGAALGGMGAFMGGEGRLGSAQSTSSSSIPSRIQSSPGGQRGGQSGSSEQRPATAQPALSTQQTPQPPAIQLSDLRNILGQMNIPNQEGDNQQQQPPPAQPPVDMSQVMTPEAMAPLLANPEIQQQLMQYLPEGESLPRDPEQLRVTLQSPQFQQAMSMFGAALQSGQLAPLIGQFGLDQRAQEAASRGDIEAFAQSLQSSMDKAEEEKKDNQSSEDKDDNMQTD